MLWLPAYMMLQYTTKCNKNGLLHKNILFTSLLWRVKLTDEILDEKCICPRKQEGSRDG